MITFTTPKHHWNYFLAIETDLEKVSRYVEFSNANLATYSIELTHILLSASSEVDVVLKQLCKLLQKQSNPENINQYKAIIKPNLKELISEEVSIDRFGLCFKPWENWEGDTNPNWWRSYNNVKHQRDSHFKEANLQNTINAVGALLITTIYYYKLSFIEEARNDLKMADVTNLLLPKSSFLRLSKHYYY